MTQTLLAVLIPTITVLVGILLNKNDSNRLSSEIAKLDDRLTSETAKLDDRLSSVEGRLDARMSALDGRFHADMMMVIGKLTELEVRVARLETQRQ